MTKSIRFNASQLKDSFEKVYVPPIGEAGSANTCVLVEQTSYNCTQFTMNEPGRGTFVRRLIHDREHTGGESDVKYLINALDFKSKLSRIKESGVDTVTLLYRKSVLTLVLDYAKLESGYKEKGSITLRPYTGAITDFKLCPTATTKIATVSTDSFNYFVAALNEYGNFSSDKAFEGDALKSTVTLAFQDRGTLSGIASSYSGYMSLDINAEVCSTLITSFEGRHLKRLGKLSNEDSIEIFYSSNNKSWISFIGNLGTVTIQAVEPKQRVLMNYSLFGSDPRLELISSRGGSLNNITSAIALQMPQETESLQELVLIDAIPNLVIMQATNIKGLDRSFVEVDPNLHLNDWQSILINSKAIKQALKGCKSYLNFVRSESKSVTFLQKTFTQTSGNKSWLLYITPENNNMTKINFFITAKLAEHSTDFLDSDE